MPLALVVLRFQDNKFTWDGFKRLASESVTTYNDNAALPSVVIDHLLFLRVKSSEKLSTADRLVVKTH